MPGEQRMAHTSQTPIAERDLCAAGGTPSSNSDLMEVLLIGVDDRSNLMTCSNCVFDLPESTDHQVDIVRDHAWRAAYVFDLRFIMPRRTCHPFKGCWAHSRRPRARCERPLTKSKLYKIEADTVLTNTS